MQLQNPWVDRLLFGGPTSSQYLELDGEELSFNTGLKIATSSSIKFGDGNSEIYSFAGGTAFYAWSSTMSNILAITSSAFVFYPDTSEQLSGLSVLSAIMGGVALCEPGSGVSKTAWMCSINSFGTTKGFIKSYSGQNQIYSCNTTTAQYGNMVIQPNGVDINSYNGSSYSIINVSNPYICFNVTDPTNGTNLIMITPNDVLLNSVSGVDGQSIGIDGSGKLAWQSPGGGGNTGATLSINTQASDYTLASGDEGGLINIDSASTQSLYVPSDASYNFEVGSQFVVTRTNTGDVIIAPDGGGVVLNSAQGYLTLNYQYSAATLIKISSDNWYVFGDLKA